MLTFQQADNFKSTISGLERGLQVIHITTPARQLLCCQWDEDVETVLAQPDLRQFDQIPVKKQNTIVGLLKRRECQGQSKGPVERYAQPLGEMTLVSADTPLLKFIQNDSLDRLVIDGTAIYGLVTRSDLLKLPVFLLGFTLVTRIETLMLDMIHSTNVNSEEWLAWLNPKRKSEIQKEFDRLSSQRSDPDMLELTYFSDKCIILKQLDEAEKNAPYLPAKSFIEQLKEIKKLRNTVAHTGNSSDDDADLEAFISRLRLAHQWIESIEQQQGGFSMAAR